MSNPIQYSSRNKAFVTQAVKVFRDRNAILFKDMFSKHSLANLYKAPKEGGLSSDFWMLNDIFVNRESDIVGEEVRLMLDTLVQIPGLSAETKLSLYLWSFPHIDVKEREAVFGEAGPLQFARDLTELKERLNAKNDGYLSSMLTKLGTYFKASVVKDQAPEDFVANYKLCQAFGGNYHDSLRGLQYQNEQDSSSFDRYSTILDALDEDTVNHMIWNAGKLLYSYDMLKAKGPKSFSFDIEYKDRLAAFERAFVENDDEFFESLGNSWLVKENSSSFERLDAALKAQLGTDQPTQTQIEIFDYIEKTKQDSLKKMFLRSIENNVWDEACKVIMDCFQAGDMPKLQNLMGDQPAEKFAPLFGAVVQQIVHLVPQMVSSGVMGERQKAFALYLHEQSTMGLEAIAERLKEMPTAKSRDTGRRRMPDDDMIVGVPFSVLTEDQREAIVDIDMSPIHPAMMHPGMLRGMPPGMLRHMGPYGMEPYGLEDEASQIRGAKPRRRGSPDDSGFDR
ncbi:MULTISPECIES: hypothetical protein [Pseudomonas]|uniref:hypothetical protein n=1 Tax=Pseudomonas TaxID=286 RepID=UPI000F02DA92|nr:MULTISPECIES: hypothetical protein [Pseudomonas]MBD8681612.1 hypothetical protein [Pseudomonas sp. CFBP 13719]